MPTLPSLVMSLIRVEEHQLVELGNRARCSPVKYGIVHKIEGRGKRYLQKSCYVYQNLLFCYESETSLKPANLLLLEGSECIPAVASDLPDACSEHHEVSLQGLY